MNKSENTHELAADVAATQQLDSNTSGNLTATTAQPEENSVRTKDRYERAYLHAEEGVNAIERGIKMLGDRLPVRQHLDWESNEPKELYRLADIMTYLKVVFFTANILTKDVDTLCHLNLKYTNSFEDMYQLCREEVENKRDTYDMLGDLQVQEDQRTDIYKKLLVEITEKRHMDEESRRDSEGNRHRNSQRNRHRNKQLGRTQEREKYNGTYCSFCSKLAHSITECRRRKATCYRCHCIGHFARDCTPSGVVKKEKKHVEANACVNERIDDAKCE